MRESSFNGCYKTIFNAETVEFKEDDNDDDIQFEGAEAFDKYCKRVFGDFENVQKANIRADDPVPDNDKPADQTTTKTENKAIKISRTNVFSREWKKVHGDPLEDDNGDVGGGHRFDQDDFQCDANN